MLLQVFLLLVLLCHCDDGPVESSSSISIESLSNQFEVPSASIRVIIVSWCMLSGALFLYAVLWLSYPSFSAFLESKTTLYAEANVDYELISQLERKIEVEQFRQIRELALKSPYSSQILNLALLDSFTIKTGKSVMIDLVSGKLKESMTPESIKLSQAVAGNVDTEFPSAVTPDFGQVARDKGKKKSKKTPVAFDDIPSMSQPHRRSNALFETSVILKGGVGKPCLEDMEKDVEPLANDDVGLAKIISYFTITDPHDLRCKFQSWDYLSIDDYLIDDAQDYSEYHQTLELLEAHRKQQNDSLYGMVMHGLYSSYEFILGPVDRYFCLFIAGTAFVAFSVQLLNVYLKHRHAIFQREEEAELLTDEDEGDLLADILAEELQGVEVHTRQQPMGFLEFLFSSTVETNLSSGSLSYSHLLSVYRSLPFLAPIPSLTYFAIALFFLSVVSVHLLPLLDLAAFYAVPYLYERFPWISSLIDSVIVYLVNNEYVDKEDWIFAKALFPLVSLCLAVIISVSLLGAWFCYVQYLNIPLLVEMGSLDVIQVSFVEFVFYVEYPDEGIFQPFSELAVFKPRYGPFDVLRTQILKDDMFIPLPDSYYLRKQYLRMVVADAIAGAIIPVCHFMFRWCGRYEPPEIPTLAASIDAADGTFSEEGLKLGHDLLSHYYSVTQSFLQTQGKLVFLVDGVVACFIFVGMTIYLSFEWMLHLRFLPYIVEETEELPTSEVAEAKLELKEYFANNASSIGPDTDLPPPKPTQYMPFFNDYHLIPLTRLCQVPFLPTIFKPQRYLCMEPLSDQISSNRKYVYSKSQFIITRVWIAVIKISGLYVLFAIHAAALLDFWSNLLTIPDRGVDDDREMYIDCLFNVIMEQSCLKRIIIPILWALRIFHVPKFSFFTFAYRGIVIPFGIFFVLSVGFFAYWWNYGRFGHLKLRRRKASLSFLSSIEASTL